MEVEPVNESGGGTAPVSLWSRIAELLKPLAMEYMVLLYGVLFLAAFCIAIGFRYGMYFRLFVTLTPFQKNRPKSMKPPRPTQRKNCF